MHGDEILQNAAITRIIQHFAGKEIFLAPGSGGKQRRGDTFLRGGFAKRQQRSTLILLITMKEITTCVQICTITLVSTQKRKNERLLLACRPAGIHSGGG
ncbi:TPA: hypothetical protein QHC21_003545 [Raoultella planticola]|uniref:Uncharacterized protein n=1 Tax=Raoultella planticola TaxID=575 RepID=A0A443VER0_RAOPL|nr:hypothetical protein CT151_23825 [Raoultella planticola]RWT15385.1 hypothetical protein DN603_27905 [Raoultella planticola]HDT6039420.1 hypothetical protein [Raoultella planticola]